MALHSVTVRSVSPRGEMIFYAIKRGRVVTGNFFATATATTAIRAVFKIDLTDIALSHWLIDLVELSRLYTFVFSNRNKAIPYKGFCPYMGVHPVEIPNLGLPLGNFRQPRCHRLRPVSTVTKSNSDKS